MQAGVSTGTFQCAEVAVDRTSPTRAARRIPVGRRGRPLPALLVLVFLLHLPSLFNPFFIDDYVYIDTVSRLDAAALADLLTSSTMGEEASSVWWTPSGALPFYRPLGELTFWVDHQLWKLGPAGYHLTNLLLHLLCTALVYQGARRLSDMPGGALAAAGIFALHPVHTEAVAWISGRFDLLVSVAILASVLAYFRWQAGGRRAWAWAAASLAGYVVGLGCKETALVLPAVIAAGEVVRWRGASAARAPRRLLAAAAAFGLVSVLYLAGRFAMFGGLGTLPPPYGLDTSSPGAALRMLAWNLSLYLLDFVLWIQVDAIYMSPMWARHLPLFAALVALAAALVVAGAAAAWRRRMFRVGALWAALFTAPCLMAMPGERNVYLSSVGAAWLMGAAVMSLWHRFAARPAAARRLRTAAVAAAALGTLVLLAEQLTMRIVAGTGEKVIADLMAALPDPPPDARIYVLHQCPLNAVGFEQALRLRYRRPDLRASALTLAPAVQRSARDAAARTGPATLTLHRSGGEFFESFVERFHLFSRDSASDLEAAAQRLGLTLHSPPASLKDLQILKLSLPLPLDDPRIYLFEWDNSRVVRLTDVLRLASLTELKPLTTP